MKQAHCLSKQDDRIGRVSVTQGIIHKQTYILSRQNEWNVDLRPHQNRPTNYQVGKNRMGELVLVKEATIKLTNYEENI
jgi:hypothetical protein